MTSEENGRRVNLVHDNSEWLVDNVEQLSVYLRFLCDRPAGVVQISGSPGVGSGHAHHHLRCDQTRPWNSDSQFAAVTSSRRDAIKLTAIPLEDSCVALFSLSRRHAGSGCTSCFCTEDEGDLCEYTTWSCTVDVHSLGHMLNVLLTLLWDESVCVAWIIIFLCESKTEVESVLPVLFQKNHNDHMKPSELVAFCYLYYFIRNLQGAHIPMKDCND